MNEEQPSNLHLYAMQRLTDEALRSSAAQVALNARRQVALRTTPHDPVTHALLDLQARHYRVLVASLQLVSAELWLYYCEGGP